MTQYLSNQNQDIHITQDAWIVDQVVDMTYEKTITIDAGVSLRYCLIGERSQVNIKIKHSGIGAKSQVSLLALATAHSKQDQYKIWSILDQAQTWSDVTMTTLLYAGSQSVVDGMVIISPGADSASGHLHEKNIVLGQPVSIRTLPQLDIRHHNVSAGHGATIDTISDRSLFYLMSKGIDKFSALQLVLQGIVQTSLDGYSSDLILQELKQDILDRILQAQKG